MDWTEQDELEHTAIVDQLRRAGWERWEAIDEADRLMHERIVRRATPPADTPIEGD